MSLVASVCDTADFARLSVAIVLSLESPSFVEKSSLRRTDADTDAVLGGTVDPRFGEKTPPPKEGFLRAGDFKNVLIGEFERGGSRKLARCSSTSSGSGIVPL